jgi:hypothetical protein
MTAREIITRLMSFRWKYGYMDQLSCTSCGALGSVDFSGAAPRYYQMEKCSPNCPWQQAEDYLSDKGV